MLRNKTTAVCLAIAVVAALGALLPRPANAVMTVCNTPYVDYTNDGGTPQVQVVGSLACFDRKSNPTLTITKIIDKATPAIGEVVTYTITVRYPKIVDGAGLCADDSQARNISVTDVLPNEVDYVANSITLSENGGAPVAVPDGTGWNAGARKITVTPSAMNEGDGDAACTGANTRVVTFQATVNAL